MDNSNKNSKNNIVRISYFPKYYTLNIVKALMGNTIKEAKNELEFLELTGISHIMYNENSIHIEICSHFSFTCHIYLNEYTDKDLYQFIDLKLSNLINSFKYLELYYISPDGAYKHFYKKPNCIKDVWKGWIENNLFNNVKYISLAFRLPQAEGQTLCNLIIFRS